MRKATLIIIIPMVITACRQEAKNSFNISGKIENAKSKKLYLEETPLGSSQSTIVDSAVIDADGSFHLKTTPKEESLFSLYLKENERNVAFVINDAPAVTINADVNHEDFVVTGSPATNAVKKFIDETDKKWAALNMIQNQMNQMQKSGVTDSALLTLNSQGQQQYLEMKNAVNQFLKNSQSPVASFVVLNRYIGFNSDEENEGIIDNMAKKFPDHKGVQSLKEMFANKMAAVKKRRETQQSGWVGQQAPEISLPDVNGRQLTLSSFRGKYVLVDFWASWCRPCREENPNVVRTFNQFRNKNFTILGVSLDSDKQKWVQAIQQDGLTWNHVSDLKEWNSAVVPVYGFAETGIPFNVLVDPAGKIIAQGLRGDELEKKLAEVLK